MKRNVILAGWVVVLALLVGCESKEVAMVKGSTFTPEDKTTIGKAFDYSFDGVTWVTGVAPANCVLKNSAK